MQSTGLVLCCAARYWYGLGGAEGHETFKTQTVFDKAMKIYSRNKINICITNQYQTKTREYLKTQGWAAIDQKDGLQLHHVSNDVLNAYLTKAEIEWLKDEREAQAKKEQEKKFKAPPVMPTSGPTPPTDKKSVSLEEVNALLEECGATTISPFGNFPVRTRISETLQERFGVTVHYPIMSYRDSVHLRNAINYQLRMKNV